MAARIIFGNLPLLGITYQGTEKDEECRRRFSNKTEMKKVLEVAIKHGIRYFASSSHNFNELVPTYMEAISEVADEEAAEVQLIPCLGIPLELEGKRIDDYRRWTTYLEYETRSCGDIKDI